MPGVIGSQAEETYRDYVVDEVPASGSWTPFDLSGATLSAADIRALWQTADTIVSALMTTAAIKVQDTRAHLYALTVDPGTVALVVADGTSANDGWYYSAAGGTGSGVWTFWGADPAIAAAAAADASATAAAASATAAAASASDAAAAVAEGIASLNEMLPQAIGPSAFTPDSAIPDGRTSIVNNPAQGAGVLESLDVYVKATGTIYIAAYSIAAGTATRKSHTSFAAGATGLQTFTSSDFGTFNVDAGDYLAIAGSGVLAYTNPASLPADEQQYVIGSNTPSSASTGSLQYLVQIQAEWHLSVSIQTVTAESFAPVLLASVGGGALTFANVDKIVFTSNSYLTGEAGLVGKGAACNVSQMSDYNFGNFALGGYSASALAGVIEAGGDPFGFTFDQYGATWAIISENQNGKGSDDPTYYAGQQELIDVLRGHGVAPIIATEWGLGITTSGAPVTVDGEQRNVSGLRALAEKNGLPFIDVTSKARLLAPDVYLPFWYVGNHPGTRACYLISDGILKGLAQLPPPLQSMKLFRVRGTVTVGSTADLMYADAQQRTHLFREIYVGHAALPESAKKEYDTGGTSYISQVIDDEYLSLLAGTSTALGAYAALECILPVYGATNVRLTLSDLACTVWMRQIGSGGSAWVAMPLDPTGTFYQSDQVNNDDLVQGDRVVFLIHKSGGITLTASPKVEWSTGRPKFRQGTTLPPAPTGAELMAEPRTVVAGVVPAAWTNSGSLAVVTPADGGATYLPTWSPSLTGVVEVTSAAGLSQALTLTSSDEARELVVRVRCRRWVAIFPDSGDFSTAPVTYETCDTATLQVTLSGPSGINKASAVYTAQVGLFWTEVEFRSTVEALVSARTIDVRSADVNIQIATVSARFA